MKHCICMIKQLADFYVMVDARAVDNVFTSYDHFQVGWIGDGVVHSNAMGGLSRYMSIVQYHGCMDSQGHRYRICQKCILSMNRSAVGSSH